MLNTTLTFILIILGLTSCSSNQMNSVLSDSSKMKGITSVGTPRPFSGDPYEKLGPEIGINWIGLVPFGYTRPGQSVVRYNSPRQWWGEKPEGVIDNIKLAKTHGLKVLLKPQVWCWGNWTGDFSCDSEEDWNTWQESYTEYIMHMAKVAEAHQVEAFCLGTEYKEAVLARPQFWNDLIDSVRQHYSGQLTYAANWDNYPNIPFWHKLDFMGVNAYFPLSEAETPHVADLIESWSPIKEELKRFAKEKDKPIVFTEWGYMSVDHAAWRTWENEAQVKTKSINQQAQANSYEAMLSSFMHEDWWLGSFLWKWFPEGMGGEGYDERDYTPQDKLAQEILEKHFNQ